MILLSFALDFVLLAYEDYLNFQTDSTTSFYLIGHLIWESVAPFLAVEFFVFTFSFCQVTTFITSSNLIFKSISSKLVYAENR